jgi:hypothetical protein
MKKSKNAFDRDSPEISAFTFFSQELSIAAWPTDPVESESLETPLQGRS